MKLAFDRARQEGAQKRPFRKLKAAAGVLVTAAKCMLWVSPLLGLTALVMLYKNEYEREEKERWEIVDCRHKEDSLEEMEYRKGWKPIRGLWGEKASASEIRFACIISKSSKLEEYREIRPRYRPLGWVGEGPQVISDVIDEYQWNVRWNRNPESTCNITPAARKEDSLYVLEGIREYDDATLARAAGGSINANQGMGAGRRESLVSASLNKFKPMLPAERDRGQDSALFRSLAAAARWALRAIKANSDMGAGEYNSLVSATLDKFRPMLPKAREREQDSVLVRNAILAAHNAILAAKRSEELKKVADLKERRDSNLVKLKAIVASTLAQEETAAGWKAMIRSALRKYEKVKAPDGCSRESDSIEVSRALEWQCICDVDCYKRWLKPAEPLSEKAFNEKWGNVSGIPRF